VRQHFRQESLASVDDFSGSQSGGAKMKEVNQLLLTG
jgi:hypothetical protein